MNQTPTKDRMSHQFGCWFEFGVFLQHGTYFNAKSIPISWFYILLFVSGLKVFFIFNKYPGIIYVCKRVNFFSWFWKFVASYGLLKYIIEWFIAITNNSSESKSPWKMPLLILAQFKVYPPPANSTFQFFLGFRDEIYNFVGVVFFVFC